MRSIREYIRKTLFDSSSILSAYRLETRRNESRTSPLFALPWSGLPTCCQEASYFPTKTMCIV